MKPIILGTTVYGRHIDLFVNWCLASILSLGNLPALSKERFIKINLHTDHKGRCLLPSMMSLHNMKSLPANVEFTLINDVTIEEKYALLGRHQNADLREAKEIGADYHCLMPDFIYSENAFAGILAAVERGHKAIGRLVMSTAQEFVCSRLEKYRYDGALVVPHIDLATIGLSHIHTGCANWLAQEDSYPDCHVQAFETKNTLRMLSPHLSPVYIAHEAIKIPDNNMPLDCQLNAITSEPIYCPKVEDGIGIIEITPRNARISNNKRVDLTEFSRIFRVNTRHSFAQYTIFNEETVDPLNRDLLEGRTYWERPKIVEQIKKINNAILMT